MHESFKRDNKKETNETNVKLQERIKRFFFRCSSLLKSYDSWKIVVNNVHRSWVAAVGSVFPNAIICFILFSKMFLEE